LAYFRLAQVSFELQLALIFVHSPEILFEAKEKLMLHRKFFIGTT